MRYAKTLIRDALREHKTYAAIARQIGITRETLHQIKTEQIKLPPERAVLLAALVHRNPLVAAAKTMLDNATGDLHDRLRTALDPYLHRAP